MRRATAQVSQGSLRRNLDRLRAAVAPSVAVAPVVKADAYGHGIEMVAKTVVAAGARWLCVAAAEEARALREAGVPDTVRVLVLGAVSEEELPVALAADADLAVWDAGFLRRLPASARVHVKLDSGFGRLGCREPGHAAALADAAGDRLAGLWTHFATADDPSDPFFGTQLQRFRDWALPLRRPGVLLHAANSAAVLRDTDAHFDLVRPGVALYGLDPFQRDAAAWGLTAALRLSSWVAAVKPCRAGESAGYGRRFVTRRDTVLATLPIGYGDGVRRALGAAHADAVIGGRRFPLVGAISMDNITIDLGADDTGVAVGDEAVLLGDGITAEELARRLSTINYEITTALLPRVTRVSVA